MFNFLSKLTKVVNAPEPNFKCREFIADPDAPQVMNLFVARNWEAFEEKLLNLSFIRQYHGLEMLANLDTFAHFFGQYKKDREDSPLIPFIEGHELVRRAYKHRGGAVTSYTAQEQFEGFARLLQRAEEANLEAAQRYPDNPVVYMNLILGYGGRRFDQDQLLQLSRRMNAACPGFLPGLNQVMTFLAPKWGGTTEEMFDYAKRMSAGPEKGNFLTTLIANAHIEQWGQLHLDEKHELAGAYFTSDAVFQSLAAAYQRSQPFAENIELWQAARFYNSFAFCLMLMKQPEDASYLLNKLGSAVTKFPWCFYGETSEEAVYRVRLHLGLPPNPH